MQGYGEANMQFRRGVEARLKKLEEYIFTPTAPPPTAEAFVFTAPGTLREIAPQQNTTMKDLAEQVARQGIALKEMQAKMDAQEEAQNKKTADISLAFAQLDRAARFNKMEAQAEQNEYNQLTCTLSSRQKAQNEKIAILRDKVVFCCEKMQLLKNEVIKLSAEVSYSCEKFLGLRNEVIKMLGISNEVAHQKTDIKHYQAKLDVLSDRIHAIEHGSHHHAHQTLNETTAKLSAEFIDITDQLVRQSIALKKMCPDGPVSSAKPALP